MGIVVLFIIESCVRHSVGVYVPDFGLHLRLRIMCVLKRSPVELILPAARDKHISSVLTAKSFRAVSWSGGVYTAGTGP